MNEYSLFIYVGFILFVATLFFLVARGHMKACRIFGGIIVGCIINFVLYTKAIILIVARFSEDWMETHNGLVMTYMSSYEQYLYRLTGLKGKADAHEIAPLADIIGEPYINAVTFSLKEEEAYELIKRLNMKEEGMCSLSSVDGYINYDKCRWKYDRKREDWMSYRVCIDTADLEKIIGKIENEGGIKYWKGYRITFLFNKRINKGILIILLIF